MTVFYEGGRGSTSIWLNLGSFGPKRLVTGVPSTATLAPYALVDNADSLLAVSDLVFVDAVGTGLSTAISSFDNRRFWSMGADVALFRDFIARWRADFERETSPLFLYGESYGGPRTTVLTRRLPWLRESV